MRRTTFRGLTPTQREKGWHEIVIDFETFYDTAAKYSLSSRDMTPENYVRDKRFDAYMVAIATDHDPVQVFATHDVGPALARIDWSKTIAIGHNAPFDGLILWERFGLRPARWVDTLALARLLYPRSTSHSLGAVGEFLNLGVKERGGLALQNMNGVKSSFFAEAPEALKLVSDYAAQDAELARVIYRTLLATNRVDDVELLGIDLAVRMSTEPVLRGDTAVLEQMVEEGKQAKDAVKHLRKRETWLAALAEHGIVPEEGTSFAKTSPFMYGLIEQGGVVAELAEQRLLATGTDEGVRAARLLRVHETGPIIAGLNANGAHTGRDSGGAKRNFQNLKRGSPMRGALVAPPGHAVVAVDLSQIEARVLARAAGQVDLVDAFANGDDPYCLFGSKLYDREITKADKDERHLSKTCVLASGYGMGGPKFQATCRKEDILISEEEAERVITTYRDAHPEIVKYWRFCDRMLQDMHKPFDDGGKIRHTWKGIVYHVSKGRIVLPSGRSLEYPGLYYAQEQGDQTPQYRCKTVLRNGVSYAKLYGGKIAENVIQAMARDVLWESQTMLHREPAAKRVRLVLRVHDELVYITPEDAAKGWIQRCYKAMTTPPEWMEDLPLDAEGGIGKSWADAKDEDNQEERLL